MFRNKQKLFVPDVLHTVGRVWVQSPFVWAMGADWAAAVGIRACSSPHTFRRLLKTHVLQSGLQFPLAAHTSASDSASGRHCSL